MNLITDLAKFVVGTMQSVAKAIDAVFGSNLSGIVSGWSSAVDKFKGAIKSEGQISFDRVDTSKYQMNRISYSDSFKKGYDWGSNAAGKATDFFNGGVGSSIGTVGDPAVVKGTEKNGSIKASLEDEDISYLKELAERDYVARIAQNTLAPNIAITFTGDIHKETDYEQIGPAIAQILRDELETAPEGLY